MKRAVLGFLLLILLGQACSLGPREDWADAIHDAHKAAANDGTARVRVAVAVRAIETNIRQSPKPLIAALDGVVDFRKRRARIVGLDPLHQVLTFDDLNMYIPRSKASVGGGSKHWALYNFEREPSVDIDDLDRRLAVGADLISPAVAVEMLEGTLTGSIERKGLERKGGARAMHYAAKLSQDSAGREIDDEDRREGVLRVFQSLGVQQDVFPVDVWVDAQGRPRRVRFVMRQQKDRVNAFELRVAWEFYGYGAKADISTPPRSETIESRRVRDFIVQFIREQV